MNTNIIEQVNQHVNFQVVPAIMTIKAFPKGKQWFIEVKFKGDAKAIIPATQDEVTQIALDLDERGWQIDQSLFHSGFNAKPKASGLCRCWEVRADALVITELDEPLAFDDERLIFASSADLWPEYDYAIEEARL